MIATGSALSRWTAQPVVKDLQFQLSLDDPKRPQEEWITVQGDRSQLTALCDAVSQYVQQVLESSPDRFSLTSAQPDASNKEIMTATPPVAIQTSRNIWLEPKGLLNHELHWGELATSETGLATPLSTLQLFDLANALDEYSADVLELPTLGSQKWVKSFPNWAQIAAVVLVAVGLSTSAIRLLDNSTSLTATAPATSQGASSSDQKIATQLPPAVVDKATPAVISNQKLPPPPVGASPPAKPGMPNVTLPKLASPSPASGTVPPDTIATYPVPVVPGNPTVVAIEPNARQPSANSAPTSLAKRSNASADNEPDSSVAAQRSSATESSAATATAFDTIPQVAEARSYFQQRWKPPEGLNQILEYSIRVDANGAIVGISPLRQASGEYIDRTGMPLVGDSFVSPLKGKQSAKIRVVLEPNGQVRTFLEE